MTLAPFHVRLTDEFDWQIPSELQSRVDLVRATSTEIDPAPLSSSLEMALNAPKLDVKFAQLITPGDRVALAVDPRTPGLVAVVVEIVRQLAQLQASLAESSLVFPQSAKEIAASVRTALNAEGTLNEIQIILHDAVDRSAIAYIGATADGDPIYVARALADADVVIPLFAATDFRAGRKGAAASFMYRHFSGTVGDESAKPSEPKKNKSNRKEAAKHFERDVNEAYWQLGVLYGVLVSAGRGSTAGQIFAGSSEDLDRAVNVCKQNWNCPEIAPAALVIAEVSGGIDQQHWGAVKAALEIAKEYAAPQGMIVLLSDVKGLEAGRSLGREVRRAKKAPQATGKLDDFGAFALALEEVSEGNPIFLRSQLSEEETEELGIGFVSNPAELNRLIEKQPRCILIRDAQHVQIAADALVSESTSGK